MARRFRNSMLALVVALAGLALVFLAVSWPAAAVTLRAAAPDTLPVIQVNYAHEWVNLSTIPLANVSIVVAKGSTIKASDGGQADAWGNFQFQLGKSGVDIAPGDAVTVTAAGYQAVVNPIGSIDGTLDMIADKVSGEIQAPFPGALTVVCEIWVKDGKPPEPIVNTGVLADGGDYNCDFSPVWDIGPGQDVAVYYFEPDGDRVINVFRGPAPDVFVNKWGEGKGQAAPGGQALFTIRYGNSGNAVANDVVLVDTLPENTAYVADTSGAAPSVGGGTVTWHLPSLPAGQTRQFYLVLSNSLSAGEIINNHIEIATSSAGDDTGNNQADGQVQVVSGQPDVYVNKDANPNDPLPGDTYNYNVGYGNNGAVTSGPIWLTDYLPTGTSLVSWRSQNDFDSLWTLLPGSPGRVDFRAPAWAGGFGDQLILTLRVDPQVPLDTQMTNKVCIGTAPDPNVNCSIHDGAWTKPARWDVGVFKDWGYGQLTPGGVINYQVSYYNNGNATAHGIWLTETLPAGTQFITSVIDMNNQSPQPFPPDYQAGQTLAWNLPSLAPGSKANGRLQLRIDDNVAPGTVITNQAQISTSDPDNNADNDISQVAETVYPPGPNLRLRKSYDWNWPGGGPGPDVLSYQIQFENIGSTTVNNVRITDTLPDSTSFSGNWWNKFWEPVGFTDNPADHQLIWTLDRLEPGWNTMVGFDAVLDNALVGKQGLVLTNTAEITTPPGDPSPADNTATAVAFTGPDLYVQKSLKAGKLYPGEIVTYTVRFGNRNVQPWGVSDPGSGPSVLITDTLPAGMTFVSATRPWDPGQSWDPDYQSGNTVAWQAWPLGNDQWASFDVVARILPSVPGGTVLTNTVEIADVVPGDMEAYYWNNEAKESFRIGAKGYLPLIRR